MRNRKWGSLSALPAVLPALAAFAVFPAVATGQQTGGLEGEVLNVEGDHVEAAEVRIHALSRLVLTDSLGRFQMTDLRPGTVLLEVMSERWGRATLPVDIQPGQDPYVIVNLSLVYHVDEIVVTAGAPTLASRAFQPAEVISGSRLLAASEPSLGETLSGQPGVSSTYFGPGASRPIVRGLGGDRVRMLESGLGTGDVSSTSPDHAVTVEPLQASRIEVIRGPATLLYGSAGIGGVVNVIDHRIPDEVPPEAIGGTGTIRGASVSEEMAAALELHGGAGPVGWRASGLLRNTGDYSIPGCAEAGVSDADCDTPPGTLNNSSIETARGALGASVVGDPGYIGLSFGAFDTKYGVPVSHGHGDGGEHEDAPVSIDLDQWRLDLAGRWQTPTGFLHNVDLRLGYVDYRHLELEGSEVGTQFDNTQWEGRVEANHGLGSDGAGVFGIQAGHRDLEAIGEEAFIPPSTTDLFAAFAYEELGVGPVRFQLGARWEMQTSTNKTEGLKINHDAVSLSAGANWTASDAVSLVATVSRPSKIPNSEELFADGPHAATGTFQVGDPTLGLETAISFDAGIHVTGQRAHGQFTGFVTSFDDFIYLAFTDAVADGLPVFQYTQADALFTGFELSARFDLWHRGDTHLGLELVSDYVYTKLNGTGESLPLIPPFSIGAGVGFEETNWLADVGVRLAADQNRTARLETSTPGYALLDASVGYRVFTGNVQHEISLRGTNLTNSDARTSTSVLKSVAPLPGRDIRLTYRVLF
jgi:iron complex outermembrane receptor protein